MHELELLDMPRFLDAVEEDVKRAHVRVWVETYIMRADRLGRALACRLTDAAARGADVRLLYDPHGSIEAEPWIFSTLERNGVAVRPYRRLGEALGRLSPAVRNHSRMLVFDEIAYTGGYAWADPWLPVESGGDGWHDLCCRVRGPVVRDFAALFQQRWQEIDGVTPQDFDSADRYDDVRLVSAGPHGVSLVHGCLLEAFCRARRRIWIENAYFFPTSRFLRTLGDAAARGVDVRIIIPGRSDLPIIARAARAEYADWLAAGLALWEYGPVVAHGKAALVDDDWCTVSTFNVNPTSVHLSIELALLIRQPAFVARLADQLERDMAHSQRVTAARLADRPIGEGVLDDLAHVMLTLTDRLFEP